MSYFGEQIAILKHKHPRVAQVEPDAIIDAFIMGIESFAWMKDGETFVGTCGTRLKDVRAELESIRSSLKQEV